ncbi:MAG TPA: hypothetical protein VF508_06820, partial [Pyrinomonadaceae bacterium]
MVNRKLIRPTLAEVKGRETPIQEREQRPAGAPSPPPRAAQHRPSGGPPPRDSRDSRDSSSA